MAYSCVKVLFEIGHEASIRNKRTPEGFTHDWEVFVRGADNSDIFHFVEKVVFHLHETFPKPKRVVKDPPYSVKESGYAGFTLPIEIYFKNSDEPKKVRFNYDLNLQPSGPPISKVLREQYVFPNPAEDLRRRLIKGGGVGVLGSESSVHLASSDKLTSVDEPHTHKHSSTLVSKPKLSSSDPNKKHKVKEGKSDESRVSNSFHALFGPPIKTAKVSPDPKKSSHSSPKVSPVSKPIKPVDKSSNDKSEKSSKSSKHGPQKEGKESSDRSGSSTKEEKKDKEKNREKDKNKDKASKRPSTPVKPPSTPPKRSSSPPKRPSSPSPVKRSSSPSKLLAPPTPSKLPSSPKHLSTTKSVKEEPKKPCVDESKTKSESKVSENNKSEKKKKDKKNRDEKPKKDKHKDHEKGSEKASKSEKSKDSKEKESSKKSEKEVIKEPEKPREKEKDKTKHSEGDKEKQRHKHKKKDKSNKDRDRDKERERDKSSKKNVENKISNEIRDKDKNGLTNESTRGTSDTPSDLAATHKKASVSSPSPSPIHSSASPLKPSSTPEKLVSNTPTKEKHKRPLMLSDDSSDSNSSASTAEEEMEPPISRIKSVKTSESGLVRVENKTSVLPVTELPRPNSRSEIIKPKSENSSQERNSLNKSSSKQKDKSSKKNKERESVSADGDKSEKNGKKSKRKRSSKGTEEGDCVQNNGEGPTKVPKLDPESENLPVEPELEEKPSVEEMEMKEESEPEEPPPPPPPATHLTEEYVSQLRELQHKIMTLEDNAELQRVVQVIAETGQYEITKKTFDFDLCALDRSTVKRLQEFFAPS